MRKLIFVYNANSGVVNTWLDIAHKVVNPSTYKCDLCMLTHGSFSEKRTWKKFRDTATIDMEFYHKDEFLANYKSKWLPAYTFPVILTADQSGLNTFMTAQEFKEIESVEALIERIEDFLISLDVIAPS